jgi:ubiquinone/menaquinone biosynthesis C-methylase UbiE
MPKPGNFLMKALALAYFQAADWLYGPFAWAYEAVAWLVSFGAWSHWRRDALGYLVPGRVLETGFGTGSLLVEMKGRDLNVTGIDPSWPMQREAGRRAAQQGLQIKRLCGVAEQLPFPGGFFANVLSTFPTNYISERQTLLEVWRVLAVGGRWVIVGLGLRFKSRFKRFLAGWLLGDGEPPWIKSFINQAREAGFAPRLVQHEAEDVILPVLILEKSDEA